MQMQMQTQQTQAQMSGGDVDMGGMHPHPHHHQPIMFTFNMPSAAAAPSWPAVPLTLARSFGMGAAACVLPREYFMHRHQRHQHHHHQSSVDMQPSIVLSAEDAHADDGMHGVVGSSGPRNAVSDTGVGSGGEGSVDATMAAADEKRRWCALVRALIESPVAVKLSHATPSSSSASSSSLSSSPSSSSLFEVPVAALFAGVCEHLLPAVALLSADPHLARDASALMQRVWTALRCVCWQENNMEHSVLSSLHFFSLVFHSVFRIVSSDSPTPPGSEQRVPVMRVPRTAQAMRAALADSVQPFLPANDNAAAGPSPLACNTNLQYYKYFENVY